METNRKTIPIREVCLGLFDGPHATPKPSDSGPIFLGIRNVGESGQLDFSEIRHISEAEYPRWIKRVEPHAGDIVFSYEATLNRYAMIPPGFRGCLGRRMALIRPDESKVSGRFLFYYFFGREWREVIAQNTLIGSTVDRIPIAKFPDFPVTMPPLQTQRKVADILSAYDDLIENNLQRIKILEEMAQNFYREWFVKFRFPGYQDARFVDSHVGSLPEGWQSGNLGEACHLMMGQSPKSEFYNSTGVGLPFHQGVTEFGDRFPSERIYCTTDGRIAEKGDILFSVRAPVGRINIARSRMVIGRGLSAIRHKDGCQWFAFHLLKEQFQEEDTIGGGTIFKSVTKKDMETVPFLHPELSVTQRFEGVVEPTEQQIDNLTQRNKVLRQTRDLLLPKLISGELDVSDLDIAAPESA